MILTFDERHSNSPYVERVWRCQSRRGGTFLSMPEGNLELVITRLPQLLMVTLRGPVRRAARVECPPDGQWLAIRFGLGVHFPSLPTGSLADGRDFQLPLVGNHRFWLAGSSWEIPTFENAEAFVANLVLARVIVRSPAVDAAVQGDERWMSQRSVQRHFQLATGMTLGALQQIRRARTAALLLVRGSTILDTAFAAGYYDQAHLTRSVKHLLGTTPASLVRDQPQLSFSSKTEIGLEL